MPSSSLQTHFSRTPRQFATLTARDKIPSAYSNRDFVTAGGLMSYEPILRTRFIKSASTPAKSSKAPSRRLPAYRCLGDRMRRREVIALFGGAGAATLLRPCAARAQQPALPVIGFLHSSSPEPMINFVAAFRNGLSEAGFVEGQNVAIEFRWAAGQVDRLPELAADLVRRGVTVIATPGSTPAAIAARAATTTIPIVFAIGANPVALGLVASLNNPGGNVTGVSFQNTELQAKALELLRELSPQAVRIVALVNPQSAFTEAVVKNLQGGAASLGVPIEILNASTEAEIESAFATISQRPGSALLVGPDPFFTFRRAQIIALATPKHCPRCMLCANLPKPVG